MKLHADAQASLNTVTGYGADYIEINKVPFQHSILMMPEGAVQTWDVQDFNALTPAHFEAMLALDPALVILGTGSKLRFAHPRLISPLTSRRIGVECMDMHAASRTYNILMAEGRNVLAALILEAPSVETPQA